MIGLSLFVVVVVVCLLFVIAPDEPVIPDSLGR
jgi:hypothetical protein